MLDIIFSPKGHQQQQTLKGKWDVVVADVVRRNLVGRKMFEQQLTSEQCSL